jgi:hypothetical protein
MKIFARGEGEREAVCKGQRLWFYAQNATILVCNIGKTPTVARANQVFPSNDFE